jgi:hypothetical protein
MKAPKKSRKKEGEVISGEDEFGIEILDVPDFKDVTPAHNWYTCEECNEFTLWEYGKTYYHKLSCSKSNGIGYVQGERINTTQPHDLFCNCMCCSPKTKGK